jgi:hypothetical protein
VLALADLDASGKDEVVVGLGGVWPNTLGLWQYANDSAWSLLHVASPEVVVPGRFH